MKIMRFVFLLIILVVSMACGSAYAQTAVDDSNLIEQQIDVSEADEIGRIIKDYADKESLSVIGGLDPSQIIGDIISGKLKLDPASLLKAIPTYLLGEITGNIGILIKLAIIAILCAILRNLQSSFLKEGTGEIAFFACYAVFVALAVTSFKTASDLGIKTINDMVGFMYASLPVLTTLMVSSGNVISGSAFQPLMIMAAEFTANAIKVIFIPAIFLSTVLSFINNISEKIQISKTASLIKRCAVITLGIIVTAFVAAVSVQSGLKGIADGVAGKTLKFAIGTFIPVIGGYLADAASTVISCTLLIKNAAGIAVMIGVVILCLLPLLKIMALILLYRLAGLLVEPLSEKRITGCFGDMANSMSIILGMVAAVALMFLISLSTVINSANTSAMIR